MKTKILYSFLFVCSFVLLLLYHLVRYLKKFFGTSDLEAVFFHLKFPVLNAGNTAILNFLKTVILPSSIFAMAIFLLPFALRKLLALPLKKKFEKRAMFFFFASLLCALWQVWFYLSIPVFLIIAILAFFWIDLVGLIKNQKIAHRLAVFLHLLLVFSVMVFCAKDISKRFNLLEFIKSQYDYSLFYEKNYIAFDHSVLNHFQPKQNLVVILAESLTPNIHWALDIPVEKKKINNRLEDPALPNLHRLLRENWFFEAENAGGGDHSYGGLETLINTWTVAGYVSYLCGVPLRMPLMRTVSPRGPFMQHAQCVPDVFQKAGFAQKVVSGVDLSFAGTGNLFFTHGVRVHDLLYFQQQNKLPQTLKRVDIGHVLFFGARNAGVVLPKDVQGVGNWGVNDKTLFQLAKEEFLEMKRAQKPFVFYLLTMDTHGEPFEKENTSCPDLPNTRIGTYQCADRLISDFVDFVLQNSTNTSIVILGDHSPVVKMNEDETQQVPFALAEEEFNVLRDTQTDSQFFAPIYNVFIHPHFAQTAHKNKTFSRKLTHFDVAPLLLESVGIRADAFALGRNPLRFQTLLEKDYPKEAFRAEITRRSRFYNDFW